MRRSRLTPFFLFCTSFVICGCATNSGSGLTSFNPTYDPTKAQQVAKHAKTRFDDGRIKEAEGYARVALSLDPTNEDARVIAAKLALAKDKPSEAINHFSYLDDNALNAETEGLLGLAYLRTDQSKKAKPFLMSALAQDPTRWREALALSKIEIEAGNLDQAHRLLKLADQHATNPIITSLEIGRLEMKRKRYIHALTAFEKAKGLSAGSLDDVPDYRVALAQTGGLEKALKGADVKTKSLIYKELGRSSVERGDKAAAVTSLKTAIDLSPRYDEELETLLHQALSLDE